MSDLVLVFADNYIWIFAVLLCQRQNEVGQKEPELHNLDSSLLIGDVKESDVVMEVNEPRYIDLQQKLF